MYNAVRDKVARSKGYQEYLDLAIASAKKQYWANSDERCHLMKAVSAKIPPGKRLHQAIDRVPAYRGEAEVKFRRQGRGARHDRLARGKYENLSPADRAYLSSWP